MAPLFRYEEADRRLECGSSGPQREPGSAVGLTRAQAEAELRRQSGEEQERPVRERLNLQALGERYLAHKETLGLRKSTLKDYEGMLRTHLVPFFGASSLDATRAAAVEALIRDIADLPLRAALRRLGRAALASAAQRK